MSNMAKQGFWYLFAGASAAILELALFTAMLDGFGASIPIANVCSTVVATVYNFMVNRNIAFKSTANPARSAILYSALFLVNMGITTVIVSILNSIGVPAPIAKACMQVCVMSWNFVLYRKVVFR